MKVINIRKIKFEFIRKGHLLLHGLIMQKIVIKNNIVPFQCNICGSHTEAKLADICDREKPSCQTCKSNLRMRSIIHLLSTNLFGVSLPLPSFPRERSISGLGMSDGYEYAEILEKKFSYSNTYYHKEPQFDITDAPLNMHNRFDFVISCDVFEHVMLPLEKAFHNLKKILKKNGIGILTVPYMHFAETFEHFPNLHKYEILVNNNKKMLKNITKDGNIETFSNLNFHGGHGSTLELRIFTKSSLRKLLMEAGFNNISFHRCNVPQYGIIWPINWSLPITVTHS